MMKFRVTGQQPKKAAHPRRGEPVESSSAGEQRPVRSMVAGSIPASPATGRPSSGKERIAIRLSPDVLAYYRATGPGWQTRIDEALRDAMLFGSDLF